MSYARQLSEEIVRVVEGLMDREETVVPQFVATRVVKSHEPKDAAEGGVVNDDPFWMHCAYTETRRQVTRIINRMMGDDTAEVSKQLILPGFNRLQTYYVVERENNMVAVSVHAMTRDEFMAKLAEKVAKVEGELEHIDEMRRFARNKWGEAQAA